ncbi:MAG: FHA domain-containing protein [Inconstantimicrobium porci]|uniref:FHA domain-containing protein n=1 Tax=Inconstantimicrobium porci TaxID=2652291 RepID=UPI002A920420|nr:FHA domain-containing protein [Inconstantimicrobium porci]MDY5912421.1 FHA domain-containing protein [Inconstantimicrobium porci]
MFNMLKDNTINEVSCGADFTYVFNDNRDFLLTDYKVLQNQSNSEFVKCMKIMYNGRIGISYICCSYKPFAFLLQEMNGDSFLVTVMNIIKDIVDVKKNGFLSCENIDISLDKIFVEPKTLKVHLVYIPTAQKNMADFTNIEDELRTSLVKIIHDNYKIQNDKVMKFKEDLTNGMVSLEDIISGMKDVNMSAGSYRTAMHTGSADSVMKIISINDPRHCVMVVDKTEYRIGKNPSLADGVISFNKAISRLHCKITNISGKYYISDLNSSNGTYVNRKKVQPDTPQLLQDGDIIRLANSDFKISLQRREV